MKGLTFLVTDRCNIACDFCAPGCGPHRRARLTAAQMIQIFDRLSSTGFVPLVVFTGGEPMLYKKDVIETIQHVSAGGLTATRIVTNAFWASTAADANRILEELQAAGLTEINYSVDDFHQEHIPAIRIRYATEAALKVGIPVLLAHKTYPASKTDRQYYERLLGREIAELDPSDMVQKEVPELSFSSGYTVPIGRGSENIKLEKWIPADTPRRHWEGPCREVLSTIQVSAEGQLSPCCGLVDGDLGAFYAGNVFENDLLDVLDRANRSVLYNWLALEGPSGIMDYIRSQDSTISFQGMYVQNCQICQEIFSDQRKLAVVTQGLQPMAEVLGVSRCLFEAQRAAAAELAGRHSASP